ncbi:hypothetical protein Tco_0445199 [Tanacetum coccineum]
MSVLPDDQMNSIINCETTKATWKDLILYHEGPSSMKENKVMDLKLCYNTFRFKEGENHTQTFTRNKALMNELVNVGIKLSKLEINTGFINGLLKKWLSFCQSLRNVNHVRDSELASLFGKLKYEENLIDNFQDSPDDEEDTRSSQEYMNDLELEFHESALLAKSKRFIKRILKDSMVLSKEDLKGTRIEHGFKRAFMSLFDQDNEAFTSMMFLNMRTHESKIDMGKALNASLVIMESSGTKSGKQDTSSKSGNDKDVDDANIKPIYDEEPMAELQLAAECNVFATRQ